MLIRVNVAEVCDARDDAMKNRSWANKNGVLATRQTETPEKSGQAVRRLPLTCYQQIQICVLQIKPLTEIKISEGTFE